MAVPVGLFHQYQRSDTSPCGQACPLRKMVVQSNTEVIPMKRALAAVLMAMFALAGCNTVEGVGRDIERGGERLQDSAEKRR